MYHNLWIKTTVSKVPLRLIKIPHKNTMLVSLEEKNKTSLIKFQWPILTKSEQCQWKYHKQQKHLKIHFEGLSYYWVLDFDSIRNSSLYQGHTEKILYFLLIISISKNIFSAFLHILYLIYEHLGSFNLAFLFVNLFFYTFHLLRSFYCISYESFYCVSCEFFSTIFKIINLCDQYRVPSMYWFLFSKTINMCPCGYIHSDDF